MSVFGLLTAAFVGVSLVFKEIDKRTIMTLLVQPIPRWQFVAGKYAGLAAVLAMNAALMGGVLALLILAEGGSPSTLPAALALILVELLVRADDHLSGEGIDHVLEHHPPEDSVAERLDHLSGLLEFRDADPV